MVTVIENAYFEAKPMFNLEERSKQQYEIWVNYFVDREKVIVKYDLISIGPQKSDTSLCYISTI